MWIKTKDGTSINLTLIQAIHIHGNSVLYNCVYYTDEVTGYYEEKFDTKEEAQERLNYIEMLLEVL